MLVTKGSDAADNLGRMRDRPHHDRHGDRRSAQAEKLLADFDAALADGRKKIADAGAAGQQFAIADGWKEGSTVSIRMFGQGALVSQLGIQLGLKNAWTGKTRRDVGPGPDRRRRADRPQGRRTCTSSTTPRTARTCSPTASTGNAIWRSLPFVQQNKLHRMPDGIWTFGGTAVRARSTSTSSSRPYTA